MASRGYREGVGRAQPPPFRCLARHDQGELVATEPCDQIALSLGGLDAARGFDQQFVADRMAEIVIHLFEVIEIDEQQANFAATRLCCHQDVRELLIEHGSIGKAGQRVVQRLMLQGYFGALALGYIRDHYRRAALADGPGPYPKPDVWGLPYVTSVRFGPKAVPA